MQLDTLIYLCLLPGFHLRWWLSTCGPWISGGLKTMPKGSVKNNYDQSEICEFLHLKFKGIHTSFWNFWGVHKWKQIENHWAKATNRYSLLLGKIFWEIAPTRNPSRRGSSCKHSVCSCPLSSTPVLSWDLGDSCLEKVRGAVPASLLLFPRKDTLHLLHTRAWGWSSGAKLGLPTLFKSIPGGFWNVSVPRHTMWMYPCAYVDQLWIMGHWLYIRKANSRYYYILKPHWATI